MFAAREAESWAVTYGTQTGRKLELSAQDERLLRNALTFYQEFVEVNRRAVSNLKDFGAAIKKAGKGESLLLLVKRGNGNLFIVVKPED